MYLGVGFVLPNLFGPLYLQHKIFQLHFEQFFLMIFPSVLDIHYGDANVFNSILLTSYFFP